MKKCIDGIEIELTAEEIAKLKEEPPIPYKERIINRIREVYSIDDELAILRQRDTKPDEFREYNRVVEAIKAEEKNNNIK